MEELKNWKREKKNWKKGNPKSKRRKKSQIIIISLLFSSLFVHFEWGEYLGSCADFSSVFRKFSILTENVRTFPSFPFCLVIFSSVYGVYPSGPVELCRFFTVGNFYENLLMEKKSRDFILLTFFVIGFFFL